MSKSNPVLDSAKSTFYTPLPVDGLHALGRSQSWDFVTNTTNVNVDFDKLCDVISTNVDKFLPAKQVCHKRNDTPWLTLALKKSCRTKQSLYYAVISNNVLWDEYKSYRNKLTFPIRLRKRMY